MLTYPQSSCKRKRRLYSSLFLLLVLLYLFTNAPVHAANAEQSPGVNWGQQEEEFHQLQSGKKVRKPHDFITPTDPTVYLTFDDGPSKLTGKVLDILKKEEIQAAFFVVGEAAKAYPDMIKRIVNEGHSIGNHTYNHVYKELYRNFDSFWEQVQRTEQALNEIAGVKPQLIRAPGGSYTNFDPFYFYYLDQAGYIVHDWNVDSRDSVRPNVPVEEIVGSVVNTPLKPVMNVLFHDGTGHEATFEALPRIIQYFKEKGYSFAALTTDVEPIQFPAAKPKWSRGTSFPEFVNWQQQTRQYAVKHSVKDIEHTKEKLVYQMQVSQTESGEELARVNEVPLLVKLGRENWEIGQDQYQWKETRVEVPLRLLMERIGGKVTWIDERKTATAHFGVYDMEYDLQTYAIRVFELGQLKSSYPFADMKLEGGSVRVSLASAVKHIGGSQITYHTNDESRREVAISFRKGFYFHEIPSILSNSLFALV